MVSYLTPIHIFIYLLNEIYLQKPQTMKRITSIKQLKAAATNDNGDYTEFYILLAGIARSSKRILYSDERFHVINEIDDSIQEDLTEEQLRAETNIIEAIEKGCFFQYDF